MSLPYEPFEIEIGPEQDGQFPVTARFRGGSRDSSLSSDLPLLRADEIEQALTWLERGTIDRSDAQDFGARLFQTLFQPPIEQFLRLALQHGRLRILLNQPMPEGLDSLPWELMFDPGGLGYLARSVRAPLARHYTDVPLMPHELPAQGPLRVLVVTAGSPEGRQQVDTQAEVEVISRALAKPTYQPLDMLQLAVAKLPRLFSRQGLRQLATRRLVEMDELKDATRQDLQNRLQDASRPVHIVHFVGHAEQNDQGSFLVLQDGLIHADDFAEIIARPGVSLVVLNACGTAASGLLGSAAEACLRRSVPAVIGMQVSVLDQTAMELAGAFYSAWAGGEPLESALASARRLVSSPDPQTAAAWSIPVLYMGTEKGLELQLKPPAIALPWQVKALRWGFAALLSLLATTALLLQVPDIARAVRQQVPWVRCAYPYPLQSGISFNVALVEFGMQDEQGRRITGKDGQAVAQNLYRHLTANIDELNLPISYDLGTAPFPCPIRGDSPEEVAANAQRFAQKVNADVLVYGSIIDEGEHGKLNPEFFVNYAGFAQGLEVVGEYQIGKPLRVDLPIEEADLELGRNNALKARNTALVNLVIGLAEYSLDDYEAALVHFRAAEAESGWLKSQGKEMVYLMIGNAYAGMAGQVFKLPDENRDEVRQAYLDQAQAAYEQALAINPQYARGQVGMATSLYQQALGSLDQVAYDLPGLLAAEQAYAGLLEREDLPASAHIPAKAHFGLGQVYMARGYYGLSLAQQDASAALPAGLNPPEQELSRAVQEFEQVLELYGAEQAALSSLASLSYANLGMLARLQGDFEQAIQHIDQAIELASPYYEMRFYALLGDTYYQAGDVENAIWAYNEGIACADNLGDEKTIEQLEAILQKIQP